MTTMVDLIYCVYGFLLCFYLSTVCKWSWGLLEAFAQTDALCVMLLVILDIVNTLTAWVKGHVVNGMSLSHSVAIACILFCLWLSILM